MDGLAGGAPAQEIRRPVSYLNPKSLFSPYAVNPATGERTIGVLFEATGALEALVPAAGSPASATSGLWLPDTVADPAAPGRRRPDRGPAGLPRR